MRRSAIRFPGYIHPDLWPLRNVLVVPDIQHEYFPEFFSDQAVRGAAAAVRRLGAESRSHLRDFRVHAADADRPARRGAGAHHDRAPRCRCDVHARSGAGRPGRAAEILAWSRRIHLLSGPHVATQESRGGISALRVLRDSCGMPIQLVCTGEQREAQPDLQRLIEEDKLPVRFLGYCQRDELPALYRHAACLVFPSLFEGFGMPVLEAMACGCPVVCSNTTSLPEIAGDAALLGRSDESRGDCRGHRAPSPIA